MKSIIMICFMGLSLVSCRSDNLIGRISDDGKKYVAVNDIFKLNSKKFNKTDATISEMQIADELDTNGYRVVYQGAGHIIDELFLFREHTDYEQFKALAQKRVKTIGDWSEITYSNVSQTDDFTLYFFKYIIIGESPYNKQDKEYKSSLNLLFCYNDSIQFVLSRFLYSDSSFGDDKEKERRGRYAEKRQKFTLNNNLELSDKIFTEGVPEPLTKEELKKLKKLKKRK